MSQSFETWPNSECLSLIEDLYVEYLKDASSVPADWKQYFDGIAPPPHGGLGFGPTFRPSSLFNPPSPTNGGSYQNGNGGLNGSAGVSDAAVRQDRVDALVRAFRVRGHMIAAVDPLGLPRPDQLELSPEFHGLSQDDLSRKFSSRTIFGPAVSTLGEIVSRLHNTYCRSIGVQFMHIDDLEVKDWLQRRMEGTENRLDLSRQEQLRILTKLTDAVIFEEFVQKKFLGAKSFSLEGSESLIPLLAFAIDRASELGVDEVVLGMAHRGRLNVLANIMGKSPRDIFREFEDLDPELYFGSGDVKYHLGHSADYACANGKQVHLSLCFNPSHLEYVNTVVLGRTRAKQDRAKDTERRRKMALVIHGDAAFAGEGIVQETLNLSQLAAYGTGGTLHVVINNQIGFTTPPSEARSTTYATDVAKMLQIPIFHVNGEDPEAVAQVVLLAMDFRDTFQRDVVIDMYGYRRYGHNEGDEPTFTQPLLYAAIRQRASVRDGYLNNLLKLGSVTREEADAITVQRREHLEVELGEARREDYVKVQDWLGGYWKGFGGGPEAAVDDPPTGVDLSLLTHYMRRQLELPEGFHPNPKIVRILEQRREMADQLKPLDWGAGEALVFASLVMEGVRVRFTGQDAGRGTFSHRHAVLHDYENGERYIPLCHMSPSQAPLEIYNSCLSEAGVLGFEYGYSLDWPDGLVIWEAQFGDFVNAAQVIIDQFISSAEDKWKRLSGITMLLPHGFEGQGPEHSSARLERFLTLASEDNMQIVQPTTPAQLFHLLRRQVVRPWRKPLVVFTPKSLLRHPRVTSPLTDFTQGTFQRVLKDDVVTAQAERILLCSGKVYYDLLKQREDLGRTDVAIVRLEQLYPLGEQALNAALAGYASGTPVIWVQEEPENMGAWRTLWARFGAQLLGRFPFSCVSRTSSASPATGSANCHRIEQKDLLDRSFAPRH
ncbi:MAG: 2-oxoglutarate dehydrogenase E1 component [Polyangiaceae bacterium]|nr:2-oxoglutarate dehydrogenase E1 component [Polyangiaceae bacterium]